MAYDPAFVLKRISHDEVLAEYLRGSYMSAEFGKTIKLSSQSSIVCEEFSSDPNSGIFTFGLSKYSSPVYVSSNQNAFDFYRLDGSRPKELDCDWCHEKFDHESTGMVVAYMQTHFTDPETRKSHLYEVFWIYGNHCTPECALGELIYTRRLGSTNTSIDCESAINYTKELFTKNTGKSVDQLIPTPYFRLLKSRGGTLDRLEGHKYIITGNIILAPAKIAFEKIA